MFKHLPRTFRTERMVAAIAMAACPLISLADPPSRQFLGYWEAYSYSESGSGSLLANYHDFSWKADPINTEPKVTNKLFFGQGGAARVSTGLGQGIQSPRRAGTSMWRADAIIVTLPGAPPGQVSTVRFRLSTHGQAYLNALASYDFCFGARDEAPAACPGWTPEFERVKTWPAANLLAAVGGGRTTEMGDKHWNDAITVEVQFLGPEATIPFWYHLNTEVPFTDTAAATSAVDRMEITLPAGSRCKSQSQRAFEDVCGR